MGNLFEMEISPMELQPLDYQEAIEQYDKETAIPEHGDIFPEAEGRLSYEGIRLPQDLDSELLKLFKRT